MLDVLLVEDNRDARECIAVWLEEAGHRVVQAGDGGVAASLLESRALSITNVTSTFRRSEGSPSRGGRGTSRPGWPSS